MKRLSRRKFFGLVGCAAAAAALPTALVGELEPAGGVAEKMIDGVFGSGVGVSKEWIDVPNTNGGFAGYVHGMPYWIVAEDSGLYLGIERTAKP